MLFRSGGGAAFQSPPPLGIGRRYDPVSDTWLATSSGADMPAGRIFHTGIWTGSEMIVWGGSSETSSGMNSGGRYDPATSTWRPTSTATNFPFGASAHSAVWTGSEMIVWGGSLGNRGGRYDPVSDSWLPTSTGTNVPAPRTDHTAVWTGAEMLVWGGTFYPRSS